MFSQGSMYKNRLYFEIVVQSGAKLGSFVDKRHVLDVTDFIFV